MARFNEGAFISHYGCYDVIELVNWIKGKAMEVAGACHVVAEAITADENFSAKSARTVRTPAVRRRTMAEVATAQASILVDLREV